MQINELSSLKTSLKTSLKRSLQLQRKERKKPLRHVDLTVLFLFQKSGTLI